MTEVYAKTNKHYRRFYEDELEHDKTIFPKPIFHTFDIMRGQSRGVQKSWFSFGGGQQDESGQESTIRVVGKFKGIVDIYNAERKAQYEQERAELMAQIFEKLSTVYEKETGQKKDFDLTVVESSEAKADFKTTCDSIKLGIPSIIPFFEDMAFSVVVREMLQRKSQAIVHLYLIKGYDFASRDIGSPSDPYLICRCGDTEFNDQENYQNDEPNPKFMKRLDFAVDFPGAPPLEIEAYDYDLLFGDDLIGKTVIDLDDRYFNPNWQAIDEKPIETRELYH